LHCRSGSFRFQTFWLQLPHTQQHFWAIQIWHHPNL
jgi:hypothetical protein